LIKKINPNSDERKLMLESGEKLENKFY